MMRENAKDIIALGFNRETTLIFSDLDFMGGEFYKNVVRVQRHININQANKTFGFDLNSSIGVLCWSGNWFGFICCSALPQKAKWLSPPSRPARRSRPRSRTFSTPTPPALFPAPLTR